MSTTAGPAGPVKTRRWPLALAALLGAILIGVGAGEALGWPFLVAPLQQRLGEALQRRVSLSATPSADQPVRIHLLGGIRISAPYLEIGAPAWSDAPHMLLANDAELSLRYADVWQAARGAPLRVKALRAKRLDGQLQRLADGRATWHVGAKTELPDTRELPTGMPLFDSLVVDSGVVAYRDALLRSELEARFSLADSADAPGAGGAPVGLKLDATGNYRHQPVKIAMSSGSMLSAIGTDAATRALPVVLDARIGAATISFRGTATDALRLAALKGRFTVQGASLAAVGDPLGVTLPTTGPFRAEGVIAKQGGVWNAVIDRASIGASRLAGAFTYDRRPRVPMLAGRLTGSQLALFDLGPAFGTPVHQAGAPPAAARTTAGPGRVLPNREFDLPALRAMDANVLIAIDNVDLGSRLLEPLRPLRTHLVLAGGVLTLRELDARTGQGRLAGTVQLDGREGLALWSADLRWAGVRLESWIHQARADAAPPWATGSLGGQARVAGQGKSTAAILASLRGGVRMQLAQGTVSHLAVEAAGLDLAQGLGMLLKGDDALPIQCNAIDLVAEQGVLRPRVFVLDTPDSTLWVDGTLSLATEAMDLTVVVAPKDFSPLALRTPMRVRGSLARPQVSLDAGRLGARVGASALLALVNPLAALIPFIDAGDSAVAQQGADTCRALARRIAARPGLAPPAPATPRRAAGTTKG